MESKDLALIPVSVSELERPDENPTWIYTAGLGTESSRKTQYQLLQVAVSCLTQTPLEDTWGMPERFPWHRLRFQHIAALQSALKNRITAGTGQKTAPKTVNRVIGAVRQVMLRCRRLGLISGDDFTKALDIDGVKGSRIPRGRMLEMEQVEQLQQADNPEQPLHVRNATIVTLMNFTGLRLGEVASLTLDSYRQDVHKIRVLGKGNKEREIPISSELRPVLEKWLELRGSAPGPFFYRAHKNGKLLIGKPMSSKGMYWTVKEVAKRAGMPEIAPHDFRRTFISQLLDAGADIKTVSNLAGHASVDTTANYDRRGEKAKEKAVELLKRFKGPATNG